MTEINIKRVFLACLDYKVLQLGCTRHTRHHKKGRQSFYIKLTQIRLDVVLKGLAFFIFFETLWQHGKTSHGLLRLFPNGGNFPLTCSGPQVEKGYYKPFALSNAFQSEI